MPILNADRSQLFVAVKLPQVAGDKSEWIAAPNARALPLVGFFIPKGVTYTGSYSLEYAFTNDEPTDDDACSVNAFFAITDPTNPPTGASGLVATRWVRVIARTLTVAPPANSVGYVSFG